MALQDGDGPVLHPGLGGGVAFVIEAPGGVPEVFQDVYEVDHDGEGDPSGGSFGFDAVDLVVVAIDEGDPGPAVGRGRGAAASSKTLGDHLGGVVDHAGGDPFVLGSWGWRCGSGGIGRRHDVFGAAGDRGDVVDGSDFGEPFSGSFLAFGKAGLAAWGWRWLLSWPWRGEGARGA